MTIDFNNEEQFKSFVNAVAQAIILDPVLSDELEDDIAAAIMDYHSDQLAKLVFTKLVECVAKNEEAIS